MITHPTSERSPSSSRWRTVPRSTVNSPPRVLLAEDDDEMRELVADALKADGYDVVAVPDGGRMLVQIGLAYGTGKPYAQYDLIVADIRMPVCSGLRILEELRRASWPTPVILMSSFTDVQMRARAEALGALVFAKPFDTDDLRTAVMHLVHDGGPPGADS